MTKNEALELLRSGKELSVAQKEEIATILDNAYVDEDASNWDESWTSSSCW